MTVPGESPEPQPVDGHVVDGAPSRPQNQLQAQLVAVTFSGPLPPPELLREYERICPGMAGRLVEQLELQSAHRRDLEKSSVAANNRDSVLGIIAGTIVSVGCLGVAAYAVHRGHPAVAIAVVTGTLVALAGVFVYGTRQTKQDLADKKKSSPPPSSAAPPSAPPAKPV